MRAATSRPGYFKKMGYDYTAAQRETNRRKFSPQELRLQEQNRTEEGGGFGMEKRILRA